MTVQAGGTGTGYIFNLNIVKYRIFFKFLMRTTNFQFLSVPVGDLPNVEGS